MPVYELDPLTDERWPALVARHADAGVFHTRQWLQALASSYGYRPIAFSTSAGAELLNAVVGCEVQSPLTGRRLVSLPFSDHCQPLAGGEDLGTLLEHLAAQLRQRRWKYVELRPVRSASHAPLAASARYHLHTIDLRAPLDELYARLHSSCIRRKIKKAEREALVYQAGRSEELLEQFRSLLLLTRRRHRLPPQPASWFRNVLRCLDEAATIHMVSRDGRPVASIVTLEHKRVLTYKYGCSDLAFSNLGGTPLLFWKAMQAAKESGLELFDLGRSDREEPGLADFKEHLGGIGSELVYLRSPGRAEAPADRAASSGAGSWARGALIRLPDPIFSGVGELLYRHLG